jgi:hypothetical protein
MKTSMRQIFSISAVTAILVTCLAGFQNCAKMDFDKVQAAPVQKANELEIVQTDGPVDLGDGVVMPTPTPGYDEDQTGNPTPTPTPTPSPSPAPSPVADDGDDEPVSPQICRSLEIQDVIVRVKSVELSPGGAIIDAQGDMNLMDLNDQGIILSTGSAAVSGHQVRLILDSEGNHLVATDGSIYALKTPSAQTSGLKLMSKGQISLEANSSYRLKAVFDPSSQIVHAGKKCLLKPVIKFVEAEKM